MMIRTQPTTLGEKILSEYRSSDLAIGSLLLTLGYKLIGIDRSEPQRARFVFQAQEGIEKVMEDFWNDVLEVNPRLYWDNIRTLKARLHAH